MTIASLKNKNMNLTSPAFNNNQPLPTKYTCEGQGVNPPLAFTEVPAEAKSLALIMDDPDAPASTFTHWTLWNIDPKTTTINENSVPAGAAQGLTSVNELGYFPPCPPSGTHHYIFKLYALDILLNLPSQTSVAQLEEAMQGHILQTSQLIGLYKKTR